jgi:hypothetical protein
VVTAGQAGEEAPSLDEATRPLAPPAPSGHAYAPHAHAVGQHLVDVHDHLRAELNRLHDLLDQVKDGAVSAADARGALNEMTMRQNNWELGAYCALVEPLARFGYFPGQL